MSSLLVKSVHDAKKNQGLLPLFFLPFFFFLQRYVILQLVTLFKTQNKRSLITLSLKPYLEIT